MTAVHTTVVGLIRDNNKMAWRDEVKYLWHWCRINNLVLKINKTKEIMDFRRPRLHTPILINNTVMEVVSGTKFLGVHINDNLSWSLHSSSLVRKEQEHRHFLQRMSRASLLPPILVTFYKGIT